MEESIHFPHYVEDPGVWSAPWHSSCLPGAGECFFPAGLLFLRFAGIGILLATILLLLGYALVAVVQGGTYNVLFEMDERGVKHTQLQKQFKRAQVLAFIGMLAGAAAANPTVVGTNMLAASKASSYSEFKSVTKIIAKPRRNTIYVTSSLEHNQIYADPAQFPFVLDLWKHSLKSASQVIDQTYCAEVIS